MYPSAEGRRGAGKIKGAKASRRNIGGCPKIKFD
jgi:hypothetical protein